MIQRPLPSPNPCISSIILWNALDPRTRSQDFSRALQAEIRDPLWMLTRQWQWGEFNAEDAGTPVFSRLSMSNTRINGYAAAAGPKYPFAPEAFPLEATAERLFLQTLEQDLVLRMELGRHWLKLMKAMYDTEMLHEVGGSFDPGFWIKKYAFVAPTSPATTDLHPKFVSYSLEASDEDSFAVLSTITGRAVDGWQIYQACLNSTIQPPPKSTVSAFLNRVNQFKKWIKDTYYQPDTDTEAWKKEQLEYQFKCVAPHPVTVGSSVLLEADEYRGGTFDWYNLDLSTNPLPIPASGTTFDNAVTTNKTSVLVPSKMTFDGMPHPRWWTFENGVVSFGNMNLSANDLARVLLMDFMFNYSNDWYLIPYKVPTGTLVNLEGIEVTDVFGVRTLVRTANATLADSAGKGWSMFTHDVRGTTTAQADTRFFLAPSLGHWQESPPLESVHFFRDEGANMVWGIEKTILNRLGGGQDGQRAAQAVRTMLEKMLPPPPAPILPPADDPAKIRYRLATNVPAHYIPMLPVEVSGGNGEIRLRRGAFPYEINQISLVKDRSSGAPIITVAPRSTLLERKINAQGIVPLYVNEEEIPRTGVQATLAWQRARWHDGRTVVWLSRRKQTARGAKPSGLKFDQLEPME